MSLRTSPWPAGVPCWADLSTSDVYFASEDVDATAARIGELGGTVLAPPLDVGPLGRMCVAADPSGAVFGVWQAGSHIGAGVVNEPGGLTWDDLRSTDPETAGRFYTALFGFRIDPLAAAGPDYGTYALPGEDFPLGGVGGMFGTGGHAVALGDLLRGAGRRRRGGGGEGGRRHRADGGDEHPLRHDGDARRPRRRHLPRDLAARGGAATGPRRLRPSPCGQPPGSGQAATNPGCSEVQKAHRRAPSGIFDRHSGHALTGASGSGSVRNRSISRLTGRTTRK